MKLWCYIRSTNFFKKGKFLTKLLFGWIWFTNHICINDYFNKWFKCIIYGHSTENLPVLV